MNYFVLSPAERGNWHVDVHDRASLEKWLGEVARDTERGEDPPIFLNHVPDLDKLRSEHYPHVVIAGDVIVPKAAQVVTRYEL